MNIMPLIVLLPLLGSLFVLSSKKDEKDTFKNAFQAALLTLFVNICLVLGLCAEIGSQTDSLIIFHSTWPAVDFLNITFGANAFNVLFILSIQMAFFISVLGSKKEKNNQKLVLFYAMLYLACLNGYFLSQDILSCYIFFVAQIFPLYMMMGLASDKQQNKSVLRIPMHHFLGAALFLASVIILLRVRGQDILITEIPNVHLRLHRSVMIWGGIFLAFVLRIPVWPFHHALTSFTASIKNPLVFMAAHVVPVTGLFGFMNYWPLQIPFEISVMSPVFQVLCIITMILTAFGAYAYAGTGHKFYTYMFVYDLLYLLAVFLPTDIIKLNIAYSVFAFLLISSCLTSLQAHIERESLKVDGQIKGLLCVMNKASIAYVLFVLAAVGLPVSAFFWNNFIIVSEIFNFSLYAGVFVVVAMTLSAVSLLTMLYTLKDESCLLDPSVKVKDIDTYLFFAVLFVMVSLLLSFINPLWFFF